MFSSTQRVVKYWPEETNHLCLASLQKSGRTKIQSLNVPGAPSITLIEVQAVPYLESSLFLKVLKSKIFVEVYLPILAFFSAWSMIELAKQNMVFHHPLLSGIFYAPFTGLHKCIELVQFHSSSKVWIPNNIRAWRFWIQRITGIL